MYQQLQLRMRLGSSTFSIDNEFLWFNI
jgi:hypothetical protein